MLRLRAIVAAFIVLTMSVPSYAQAPRSAPPDGQRYREVAQALEPAAYVSVRLSNGKHLTGTVLDVRDESFTLQRHSRIPEPSREIRFDDVVSLERARRGMNSGAKVLIGVGASVAVFLVVMLVGAAAISD